MIEVILSVFAAIALVILAAAVFLRMVSQNTVDRDEDAEEAELRIKQIVEASQPAPLNWDTAYKEVRRVRGLS